MAARLAGVSEAARVRLAAGGTANAATLLALATDRALTVRAALAVSPRASSDVNDLLAADKDAPIRVLLARKLATALPQLTAAGHAELVARATATLTRLVEDAVEQVRAAISAALQGWPHAPRELVLRLARDASAAVSSPVIRLSQMLTEADLLQLLADMPAAATIDSVAARTGLSEAISDAVMATADTSAIATLLSNSSAAIREATLDALVARCVDRTAWQGPLVRRPSLPPRAALQLSGIVTADLLVMLMGRPDLDPALLGELRSELAQRTGCGREAFDSAGAAKDNSEFGEAAFAAALAAGERWRAMGILAAAAAMPFAAVDRVGSNRGAKSLLSLLWKAGYSMRVGVAAQSVIASSVPGDEMLASGDGGFPLSEREMVWHIELLLGEGSAPREPTRLRQASSDGDTS
jgi:uncharacterized protein (DUF2336 family)